MRRILLTSSLFVAAAALPLAAEEISLKDGTKIVGHMISVSSDKIEVETSYGKMQLKRSDILEINFPENGAGTSAASGTSNNTAPSTAASVKRDGQSIDDSLQGTQYLNRTGKFSLTLPPNWKINSNLVRSPQTMGGVSSRDEMRFVLVSREEYTGSLESYEGLGDIQVRRTLEDYEELSSAPITIDGKVGVLVSYRGTMPKAQNLPVQFLVAIFPSTNGYTRVAAWCVEPLFHEMQPTFERILNSYRGAEGNSRTAQVSKP